MPFPHCFEIVIMGFRAQRFRYLHNAYETQILIEDKSSEKVSRFENVVFQMGEF